MIILGGDINTTEYKITGEFVTEKNSLSGDIISGSVTTPYRGDYEFTPSEENQTIEIEGKTANQDIIINPIPSN